MKVLMSVASTKSAQNPYIAQLVQHLNQRGTSTSYWTWRTAICEHHDVVHLHWPERLFQARGRLRSRVKGLCFLGTMALWKLRSTKITWTVHNVVPHEPLGRFEAFLDRRVRRSVSAAVVLNRADVEIPGLRAGTPVQYIPHGHYRDWYQQPENQAPSDQIAFVGMIRPYKGLEDLISAFRLGAPVARLVIAGKASSATYAASVSRLVGDECDIEFRPGYVDDSEMCELISESRALVLPYRNLYNSGVVFLALSLHRPVIVPRTPTTELLEGEFGSAWIRTYEPPLSRSGLESALEALPASPVGTPDLSRHEWQSIAGMHHEFYATVVAHESAAAASPPVRER